MPLVYAYPSPNGRDTRNKHQPIRAASTPTTGATGRGQGGHARPAWMVSDAQRLRIVTERGRGGRRVRLHTEFLISSDLNHYTRSMSRETLQTIEAAIQAHYEDCLREQPDQEQGMMVDWVVGWTVHALVDIPGEGPSSGYANWWAGADTNPNGQAYLAQWVGTEIAVAVSGVDDD